MTLYLWKRVYWIKAKIYLFDSPENLSALADGMNGEI